MLKSEENTIKIISPAKVNLFLAVGAKNKKNNLHEVLNIMHTLLLHDILYFNYKKNSIGLDVNIEFLDSDDVDVKPPNIKTEDNLIYKSIKTLCEKLNFNPKYSINIYVEKNIPNGAGLAGGSSNAAAALIACTKIFKLKKDHPAILETAKEIGCDVAFFLEGGCALFKGYGEIFDHSIQPINKEILLLKPIFYNKTSHLSTKEVYKTFDKMNISANLTDKFNTHIHSYEQKNRNNLNNNEKMNLYEATKEIIYADNIPLFNNLAYASEKLMPELSEIKSWLSKKVGVNNVLLAGSGSATFALIPDKVDTNAFIEEAKSLGHWVKLTQLANVKCKIMPTISKI